MVIKLRQRVSLVDCRFLYKFVVSRTRLKRSSLSRNLFHHWILELLNFTILRKCRKIDKSTSLDQSRYYKLISHLYSLYLISWLSLINLSTVITCVIFILYIAHSSIVFCTVHKQIRNESFHKWKIFEAGDRSNPTTNAALRTIKLRGIVWSPGKYARALTYARATIIDLHVYVVYTTN